MGTNRVALVDEELKQRTAPAPGRGDGLASSIASRYGDFAPGNMHVLGVCDGEGIGPEVVPVALRLLEVLCRQTARRFEIRKGGPIGKEAKELTGKSFTPEITKFAAQVFADGGALFCGPGCDRFVYEQRQAFRLFCKFTPVRPVRALRSTGPVRETYVDNVDIVAVRENLQGIYQGQWSTERDDAGDHVARHEFAYSRDVVNQIVAVALKLAARRKKRLHLVLKSHGVPSISELWRQCADDLVANFDVEIIEQEIDNTLYQLVANPHQFDVIVSPNMMGDMIADCAALLLASRGLSYSGNFSLDGKASYQTGHGAARDIAGRGVANPIGQIFSLAMLLKESFGWEEGHRALHEAVEATINDGFRTADIAVPGCVTLRTFDFGVEVERNLEERLSGKTI